MEYARSKPYDRGFVHLVCERDSGIEVVVVAEMVLDLIPHTGRNQQTIGKFDIGLNKSAEFELRCKNQRIALIHRKRRRRSGKVRIQTGEGISAQEVVRVIRVVSEVIALHSCLQRESLAIEAKRVAEEKALVGVVADILPAATLK